MITGSVLLIIGKHIEENDPIVGAHYFDKKEGITYGSWETGQVFSTPFWVGYKNGNQVFRVGDDHGVGSSDHSNGRSGKIALSRCRFF